MQRPQTDFKTPNKESPKGKRRSQDTSFDQKQRSTTPKHQSLDLSQLQSPQIMGRQTPMEDTQTTELPLNIIIDQANKRKDQLGAPGVFGGSFSGQPKYPRERTSRDQRRKKRELERMETHLGSSSGIRGGPVQDELMRHIMNDFNGLRESDVREITTLRNMPSDQTPRGEISDRKIAHDPHQRLEQLDRKLNASQQIGQKTPVPQSKTQFSPQHAYKEPNSTQKFADLKNKIDNLPNFRPDAFALESYPGSKPQEQKSTLPPFLNSRRSRQERSASSSGERQVDKKKTSDPIIGTPEKEQDLTLQNYIKQLSGTQRILSPREQAQASHFQKRKSNGLMDLPLHTKESSKLPQKGQPLGEMIDEFDYKSKSPTNVGSRAKDVMGVPQNPYSSAKLQNHLGSDINSPAKHVQSFTLNPYNQSVPQSATSLKGPVRMDRGSTEDPQLFGALGPYGLPDQPLFIQQYLPQSSGPQGHQRNTPITKQRSGGDIQGTLNLGASSPISYLEHQRSPSDRGLPGRPAMTPSSGAGVKGQSQQLALKVSSTPSGLQRQQLLMEAHRQQVDGDAEAVTQSQQSSKQGFGTFGANRSSMEERKRSPAVRGEDFQIKDRESKLPMRSVASSPNIHSQPNNRYVRQPSPQKASKSSLMTPKSQQSLKSRSNKTQSRLRELGARLHESIVYDGVTMKSIDYRLIHQLQSEAALVIQRQWRAHQLRRWPSKSVKKPKRPFKAEKKAQSAQSDWQSQESIARTCKHGHTCERGTLTSPPSHKFCGLSTHCCCCSQFVSSLSQEKLQMFLSSTVHSYMMLNCLMADVQHNHLGGGSCCNMHNQR